MGDFVNIPKATLLHVVDLLASGIPIRKIAAEFEYSASTISNRLFEEGLPHNIGLAKEWVRDRDSAWSRQLEDVIDANDGIEITIAGRPELSSFDMLKSDLGFRDTPISSLIEAVFEWDGDFWRLVRGRYYPVTTAISLRWATKLTTGKQIVEALNKVRPQEERVRFQARIWLHKLPSEGLHIYPATIVSKGYPLYRKAKFDKLFLRWMQETGRFPRES